MKRLSLGYSVQICYHPIGFSVSASRPLPGRCGELCWQLQWHCPPGQSTRPYRRSPKAGAQSSSAKSLMAWENRGPTRRAVHVNRERTSNRAFALKLDGFLAPLGTTGVQKNCTDSKPHGAASAAALSGLPFSTAGSPLSDQAGNFVWSEPSNRRMRARLGGFLDELPQNCNFLKCQGRRNTCQVLELI